MTVQDCLRATEFWKKRSTSLKGKSKLKSRVNEMGLSFELFTIKGERYRDRDATIREWLDRDRQREERVNNAPEPQNIFCPTCHERMTVGLKDLYDFPNEPVSVLFFFECPLCKKRKGVFEDGRPHVQKPEFCSKCKKEVKVSYKKKGNVITTIKKCSACGFTEKEVDDYDKRRDEREERTRQERILLEKHRAEFCLSSKEGEEYLESIRRLESLKELLLKIQERQTDPDYKKVDKLKRLKIFDLERILTESLEKEKYVKLSFEKPVVDKHIIVPFSIQDADSSRRENDSVHKLQRLLKKMLADTNWRLMSDGVSCKLGFLSGRLKGYEEEGDLLKIVKDDD